MDPILAIRCLIDAATPWLAGAASLFALMALGALFAERRPYREPLTQFRRLGHFWQVLVILFVCSATRRGGAKPDGGDRGVTEPTVASRMVSVANPGGDGGPSSGIASAPPSSVTDTAAFSNIVFSAIAASSTNVVLAATWDAITNREEVVDVYVRTNLVAGTWGRLAEVPVNTDWLGASFGIPVEWLPESATYFFRLGSRLDSDGDGLTDAFERLCAMTNPTEPDTDGDGLSDGWELTSGFCPVVNNLLDDDPANDPEGDSDIDGLDNYPESILGTSITSNDTDCDGVPDGVEVPVASLQAQAAALAAQAMLNPLLLQNPWFNIPLLANCSNPCSGDNADYVAVAFYYGDPSSSASEKYALVIEPVAGTGKGDAPQTLTFVNGLYGVCDFAMAFLKKGWRYHVRLRHASTDFSKVDDPDPDYALLGAYASAFLHFSDQDGLFGVTSVTDNFFTGQGKFATIDVYDAEIALCDPDSGDWAEMDESRVVLNDEPLRVKISAWPCFSSAEQIKTSFGSTICLKTDATSPDGSIVAIPSSATFETVGSAGELRFSFTRAELQGLGLLPAAEDDGVEEKATLDNGVDDITQNSNLTDSTAFNAITAASRHDATRYGDMEAAPPSSSVSKWFFKAAGVEYVRVEYGGSASHLRQVMNQADYFYCSGHGNHRMAMIHCTPGQSIGPSEIGNYWREDLKCVVFAGCSVMDIGDFVAQRLTASQLTTWKAAGGPCSPGKQWRSLGPTYLLGYGWYAPRDTQGATAIATTFATEINAGKNPIEAWRVANNRSAGRNACAIDLSSTPAKFWYWKRNGFGGYIWDCKTEGADW